MKPIKILVVLVILAFATSIDAFSHPRHHPPVVRTPLDGGILTVLGVAGIAYYAARKKKNNSAS